MRYIEFEECMSQIDETRIDRKNNANVYLAATKDEVVLEFAYSVDKKDHIVLKRMAFPEDRSVHDEIWVEYLATSMLIAHAYGVERIVDDVRKPISSNKGGLQNKMAEKEINLFSEEQKNKYYERAEKYLAENGLECMQISRSIFTVSGAEGIVKVHLLPFTKDTVSREQLLRAKALKHVTITNDRYSRHKKGTVIQTRENGYVWFEIDKEEE